MSQTMVKSERKYAGGRGLRAEGEDGGWGGGPLRPDLILVGVSRAVTILMKLSFTVK